MNDTPPSKRSSKKFLTIFCILVLVSTLFLASLPSIISSQWGKNKLVGWVNKSIPGKIRIDDLSLGWLGPQTLSDMKLNGPDGVEILSLGSLKIDVSLFSLLLSPHKAAELQFNALQANLSTDKDGVTNLARALDKRCCEAEKGTGGTPVEAKIKDANGSITQPEPGALSLNLNGKTLQGNTEGTFQIVADLGGISSHELLSANGGDIAALLAKSPGAELNIQADIVNFPVEVIDQVVALRSPAFAGLIKEFFGTSLNLSIRQKAAANGIGLSVAGSSPTFKLNADALLEKQLVLAKPAEMTLQITPALVNKLAMLSGKQGEWRLLGPSSAHVIISGLNIPSSLLAKFSQGADLEPVGIEASIELAPASISFDSGKTTLSLKQLRGTVNTTSGESTAAITFNGEADHQGQPVRMNINLKVPKTASVHDFAEMLNNGLAAQGTISGAVPRLAETLLDDRSLVTDIFGGQAELKFSVNRTENKTIVNFALASDHLNIPSADFAIDDKIVLLKPFEISLSGAQGQNQRYSIPAGPSVEGPLNARFAVQSLTLPLSALHYFDTSPMVMAYKMVLDAKLIIPSLKVNDLPVIGTAAFSDLVLRIDAEPKKRPEVSLGFNIVSSQDSSIAQFIGDHAGFQAFASLGIGLSGQPTVNVFNVQLNSDLARLDASGEVREGNQLVLNTPSMINYTITTAGLQAMGLPVDSYLFNHETPLQLTIDSSHIPLSLNDLSRLRLNGRILINDLELMKRGEGQETIAALDNLKADWSIDAASRRIGIDFTGLTRLGESKAAGKIDGTIAIDRWIHDGNINLSNANVRVDTMATNLPTELIGIFTGQTELVPIIGSAIDLEIKGNAPFSSSNPGTISLNIESEHLHGGMALALGDVITLSSAKPAEFTLNLTPQGYAAIRKRMNPGYAGEFILAEGAKANLRLHSLNIPRSRSILQGGVDGNISLGPISGVDRRTKERVRFDEVEGSIRSSNIAEKVEFTLYATGQKDKGESSQWNIAGILNKGFNGDGSLNRQDLSLSLDATVQSLPVPLLCQFACVDPDVRRKIEAVVGSVLDANIKANLNRMNGPLFVDIKGNNGHLTIDAMLSEGVMYLNRDLTAELKVTPALGEHVLEDLIPVISGMLSAAQPIKLTISQQGFSLPLRSPSLENITIGGAALDMGKVTFSNDSQMAKVLSLLVSSSSDQVLVWLTPAYFSLNQGQVRLERVDMLISDRYPIAAWGDADIGRDRVNMVIGLSGAAIRKAFNIGGIPNTYFLQLPLKGKLHNPSIDKAKAAGRISALVAQSQGGPQGLVLGTVLDIATGGLTENTPPKPTTNPLPWGSMMQDDASSGEKTGKGESKVLKPIEEVGKGASSLLKKIFK